MNYHQHLAYKHATQAIKTRREQAKKYKWAEIARPSQLPPPGDWSIWCIIAGRGFGKTRAGAEALRSWVTDGVATRIALVGSTLEDVRKVMIEGESGLLGVHPPGEVRYYPGVNMLKWRNGSIATAYSADAYESLRGPQFDAAWVDELAKFSRPQEVWDQLMLCLRIGAHPRVVVTTTPRPLRIIRDLIARDDVVVTRGSTHENRDNLASSYLEEIERSYGGTTLGKQEIEGEVVSARSLWRRDMIRVWSGDLPRMRCVVVGLDPAATTHGNETGIVTVGMDLLGRFFVLSDASGNFTPKRWAEIVEHEYKAHAARIVVAEVNQGGEMVAAMLRGLHVESVRASRSKSQRASPIAALYEQELVWHAQHFPELEEQLLEFETADSPDRVDALVWAISFLRGLWD